MAVYGPLLYVNDVCASLLSLFLNCCLLYCVIHNWTLELRQLNVIIIQNIILDVIFALFPITISIWLSFIDGKIYVFMLGPISYLPHQIGCVMYCFFCMMLVLIVYAFAIQFYFRYKTLCRNVKVSVRLQLALWTCAIFFALAIAVAFIIVYDFQKDLKTYNSKAYEIASRYFDVHSRIPFVVAPTSSLFLASIFGIGALSLLLSFALSVHYARQISKFVYYSVSLTNRFKNVYITFHRSLRIQALIFYASAVTPLIMLCATVLLQIQDLHYLFGIGAAIIAWIPVINPAVFLYLTRPYRRFLLSKIRRGSNSVGIGFSLSENVLK